MQDGGGGGVDGRGDGDGAEVVPVGGIDLDEAVGHDGVVAVVIAAALAHPPRGMVTISVISIAVGASASRWNWGGGGGGRRDHRSHHMIEK
jgi:hypothetical protein